MFSYKHILQIKLAYFPYWLLLCSVRIGGLTWDVTKVPKYAEVRIWGNDTTLKDLLADHRGEGVFGCMHVGLDQPRVLWTFKGEEAAEIF